jgi:hypothetical protein
MMKNVILAATALLSIGAGSAFAESGDGWDMVQTLSARTPAMARPAEPKATTSAYGGVVIAHSTMTSYAGAPGFAATPRTVTSMPAASQSDISLMSYPLN